MKSFKLNGYDFFLKEEYKYSMEEVRFLKKFYPKESLYILYFTIFNKISVDKILYFEFGNYNFFNRKNIRIGDIFTSLNVETLDGLLMLKSNFCKRKKYIISDNPDYLLDKLKTLEIYI
jgi:hypothetical protein